MSQSPPPVGRSEFGAQLQWPAESSDDLFDARQEDVSEDVVDDESDDGAVESALAGQPPPPPALSMAPSISGITETDAGASLEGALALVAARVDVLASTTVTFRNMVGDRISEVFVRTDDLVSQQAAEAAALRREVARCLEAVASVSQQAAQIAEELSSHRSEIKLALDAIAEELHGLRRRTPVRSARPAKFDEKELQGLAERVADSLRRDAGRVAPRPRRTRSS